MAKKTAPKKSAKTTTVKNATTPKAPMKATKTKGGCK